MSASPVSTPYRVKAWMGLALAVVVLAGLIGMLFVHEGGQRPSSSGPRPASEAAAHVVRSLAILPFRPLDDRTDPWLPIGMADALVTRLSDGAGLVVRPTTSVLRYGDEPDPLHVGRRLQVDAVLEGSLQQDGERIRVNARLLSVHGGTALWSGTFEDTVAGLFEIQDALVGRMGDALSMNLQPAGWDMRYGGTRNVEAFRLYNAASLQGNPATLAGNRAMLELYASALGIDPRFGLAMIDSVFTYCRMAMLNDIQRDEIAPQAIALSRRSLAQAPEWYYAHVARAASQWLFEHDWAGAEASYRRALAMTDRSITAHQGYAQLLSLQGQHEAAVEHARQALLWATEGNQSAPITASLVAGMVGLAGNRHEAHTILDDVLANAPVFVPALLQRGFLFDSEGEYEAAVSVFEKAARLSQDSSLPLAHQGHALARAGKIDEAMALLDRLQHRSRHEFIPATRFATILVGLGEHDPALTWLETGLRQGDPRLVQLKVDRHWQPLHDHPRFQALLERMNLAGSSTVVR